MKYNLYHRIILRLSRLFIRFGTWLKYLAPAIFQGALIGTSRNNEDDYGREFMLGFGPVRFKKGETKTITSKPQMFFNPTRLVINNTERFELHSFSINSEEQFSDKGKAVPCTVFSENAFGVSLGLSNCEPNKEIVLVVRCIK